MVIKKKNMAILGDPTGNADSHMLARRLEWTSYHHV
jgi:hypothetical protein